MAAHNSNRRARGRASLQRCEHCGGQAAEWALNHEKEGIVTLRDRFGEYSAEPMDYIALCKPCHQRFDAPTVCPQGHEKVGRNLLIDEGKRKCRTCVYARNRERRRTHPMTAEQKARKLELQRQRRAREKRMEAR